MSLPDGLWTARTRRPHAFSLRRIMWPRPCSARSSLPALVGAEPAGARPATSLASGSQPAHGNGYGTGARLRDGQHGRSGSGRQGRDRREPHLARRPGHALEHDLHDLLGAAASRCRPATRATINQYFTGRRRTTAAATDERLLGPTRSTPTRPAAPTTTRPSAAPGRTPPTPIPDHCSSQYSELASRSRGCVLDTDLQAEIAHAIAVNPGLRRRLAIVPRLHAAERRLVLRTASRTARTRSTAPTTRTSRRATASTSLYANQPVPRHDERRQIPGSLRLRAAAERRTGPTRRSTSRATSTTRRSPIRYSTRWYDANYDEDGDKCAWSFGTALGGVVGTAPRARSGTRSSTATTTTSSGSGTTRRAPAAAGGLRRPAAHRTSG